MEMEDNSREITQSQIKVLLSDWLGNLRQGEDAGFVHKGKGGIRSHDESIVDYLLGGVEKCEKIVQIKKSLMAARNLISTITPEKVNVITGGSMSYHGTEDNGCETICIATDYYDSNNLTPKQKSSIMLGLACHEAAHSAYTEDEPKMRLIKKYPASQQDLVKQIWNVLEDERIEYFLTDKSPGLASLLAETKRHYFKKYEHDVESDGQKPTEPLPKLLNALLLAVRYPSELTEETVIENYDMLDSMRKVLTPYPLTPEQACEKTDEIMSIIKRMITDELQQQQQQQSTSGSQQQQGGPQQQQPQNQNTSPSEQQIQQALNDAIESNQAQKVLKAMKNDDEKGQDNANGNKASNEIRYDCNSQRFVNEDNAEMMEAGSGFDPDTYVFKPKGDAYVYARVARSVKKYVPAMSKALSCKSREREFMLDGLPSGRLNMNKLVALQAGNTHIFSKRGLSRCSAASICVLIDESESMSGEKERAAREAAILLNESIKHIKTVNYYCYGYSENLHVFCEAGRMSPWSLSEVGSYGGTPTGQAMICSANRIRKRTKEPILMLVLTDGSADDTERVIQAEANLKRQGFTVIGVGIQTNYVKNSFKDSLTIMDVSELPVKLGSIARKYLSNTLVKSKEML